VGRTRGSGASGWISGGPASDAALRCAAGVPLKASMNLATGTNLYLRSVSDLRGGFWRNLADYWRKREDVTIGDQLPRAPQRLSMSCSMHDSADGLKTGLTGVHGGRLPVLCLVLRRGDLLQEVGNTLRGSKHDKAPGTGCAKHAEAPLQQGPMQKIPCTGCHSLA